MRREPLTATTAMIVPTQSATVLGLALVLTASALAAAGTQGNAPDLARPGQLVDIGGRRLHLHCVGRGQPTVVFEPSFAQFALDWWLVQPVVAQSTRACAYDRAGLGWSDPGPRFAEHPEQIVRDLHAALAAAGETPPFVFVSMSMGAFYTRAYHQAHPREVAGFVFVEPATEDAFLVPRDGVPTPLWSVSAEQASSSVRAMANGPRPAPPPLSSGAPFDRLPAQVLATRLTFEQRAFDAGHAESVAEMVADVLSRRVVAAGLHAAGAIATPLPVVVLSSDRTAQPSVVAGHLKTAALSPNAVRRIVRSGHFVHLEAPDVVARAIEDVVVAVRTNGRLAP